MMNSVMSRCFAAFALLIPSCSGGYEPDITLEPGVEISLNGYEGASKQEMQVAYNEVISDVKSKFPLVDVNELMRQHLFLSFESGLGDCKELRASCPTKLVGWANTLSAIVYYSTKNNGQYETDSKASLNKLAFKHELAHVLLLRSKSVAPLEQDAYIGNNFGY